MAIGRWIKRIVIALVAVVVLLFAAVAIALMLVDTRMLQDRIAEEVEEATGRELHFEGDLSLSFFPWLGFSLGETRLANAPGFDQRPFARIGQTQMRVQVLPLLRREIALDTLVLDGLELNLAIDADGRSNWADLEEAFADEQDAAANGQAAEAPASADDDAADAVATTVDEEAAVAPGELPFDLRINGLEFRNANIFWRDASTDTVVDVRDFNLSTGPLVLGEPTPVQFQVRIEPDDAPALNMEARTRATVTLEPMSVRLEGFTFSVVARGGDMLPPEGVRASLNADIAVDVDGGLATIAPLQLRLLDLIEINGRTEVDFGAEEPAFAGRLDVASFNPRAVLQALGEEAPGMDDPEALTRVALGFAFDGTPAGVALEDIELRLDDTRMEGELQALLGEIPDITARLHFDVIDLDRYLPPQPEEDEDPAEETAAVANGTGEPTEPAEAPDPVAELPLELLHELDADVRIRFDRIGYSGLDARDTAIDIVLAGGVLSLERFTTLVAEGEIDIAAVLDASAGSPAVRLDATLGGVQAGPIADAFMEDIPVMGRLDATLGINTRGDTLDAWIGGLDGRVRAEFSNGGLRGFNLARELRVAYARYRDEEDPAAAEERRTDFSSLRYRARIDNGVIRTELLDLRAPLLRVSGEGSVDLPRERIDHLVRVLVTDALEGQDGRTIDQLRGLTVPIRITGPLTEPRIRIQIDEAIAERLRQEAEAAREALRREQEEIEQRLREEREAAEQRAREQAEEAERRARERLEREREEAERRRREQQERMRDEAEDAIRGLFD